MSCQHSSTAINSYFNTIQLRKCNDVFFDTAVVYIPPLGASGCIQQATVGTALSWQYSLNRSNALPKIKRTVNVNAKNKKRILSFSV